MPLKQLVRSYFQCSIHRFSVITLWWHFCSCFCFWCFCWGPFDIDSRKNGWNQIKNETEVTGNRKGAIFLFVFVGLKWICLCIKWFIHDPCAHSADCASVSALRSLIHFDSFALCVCVLFFFLGVIFFSWSICYYSPGVSACYLDLCDLITAYNKLHIHAIRHEFITNVAAIALFRSEERHYYSCCEISW